MSLTAPLHTGLQTSEPDGRVHRLFHRWLSALRKNALQFQSIDVDLGSSIVVAGSFTITDAEINPSSLLLVVSSPGDEENAMEPIAVTGWTCSAGSALVEWESASGHGTGYDGAGELIVFDLGAVTGTRTFLYAVSG